MKLASRLLRGVLLCVISGAATFVAAQARPFPASDVQQIYQHLLPQIEKIPAFDHHAHPGFSAIPTLTPWPRLPTRAKRCARAMIIPN